MHSAMEMGLNEAFVAFHEAGHYEYTKIEIENLECDQKEDHYPDICWHYRYTISYKA